VIGKVEELLPVQLPSALLPPPTVIEFESIEQLEPFVVTQEYCERLYLSVRSINHLGIESWDAHVEDMPAHNKLADLLAAKLLARLPFFLDTRIHQTDQI
jgi:hypothetical protein